MTLDIRKYLGAEGPVKPQHAFDAERLDRYLDGVLPRYRGPLHIRQFEGGQSNPTYRLETSDRSYVLRRKPPGALTASAHQVDREFRVIGALWEEQFPVPEPLAHCTDPDVIGTEFYLMAHVEGRVFRDCTMPDLDARERAAVFDSVNETLATLHSFDPARLGLANFGRRGNYFARQIARWSKQYVQTRTTDIPAMERLMAWLPENLPDDEAVSLLHGDYSFHNILVHPAEPRVAAVIDWELSTTGHPFGDLTYHLMDWYRPAGTSDRNQLGDKDLSALGIPSLEEYVSRYCERMGRAKPVNLGFYQAYNLFRLAAILQAISARARAGTAVASSASQQEARVRPLAEAALRYIQHI